MPPTFTTFEIKFTHSNISKLMNTTNTVGNSLSDFLDANNSTDNFYFNKLKIILIFEPINLFIIYHFFI